jgi:transmembrane sensor
MSVVPEERRLFREAADLAIRLQNDPGNAVAIDMIRNWTARSPQHAAAWSRVAEIHGMAGKVLSDQRIAAEPRPAGLSRRTLVIGGLSGLGAVAAGSLALPRALLLARADHVTATGEVRRIVLDDGTVTTLGPDSAIALDYSPARRAVDLLAGMAYFEVARLPDRPFSARSGAVSATALGTAFDMSSDASFVSVAVGQGSVEVRRGDAPAAGATRLAPGDWITFDPSSVAIRGTREEDQIGAWRSGLIVAEREAVAAVVAKIARWQAGRVVIVDPFLGSRLVSGVFDLADPRRALEAAVRPFGAKVRSIAPFMTLISPV